MHIRPEDVVIELYPKRVTNGAAVPDRRTGVQVTHTPTGTVAFCTAERHMHLNKKQALLLLAEKLNEPKN
jgi:peptide chain release factor 1